MAALLVDIFFFSLKKRSHGVGGNSFSIVITLQKDRYD